MKKLLLLHGALGAKEQLLPLAKIANAFGEVHILEFSGHGETPINPKGFSIEVFADEIVAHLQAEDLLGCAVLGYSMGGYAALFAEFQHPGLFSHITTLGTKFAWNPQIATKETARLQPAVIQDKVPALAQQLARRHKALNWEKLCEQTVHLMNELGQNPLLTELELSQIETEVLLSLGDDDQMVSIAETVETREQLPNAALAIWPHTPHLLEKIPHSVAKHLVQLAMKA